MTQPISSKYYFISILILLILISCEDKTYQNEQIIKEYVDSKDSLSKFTTHNQNSNLSKSSLSYLLEFNGQSIFQKKLFREEPLLSRLKKVLGNNYQFLIDCCYTESTIKVVDDNIVLIEACQSHNCPAVNYVVYIDINADEIFVGLFDEGQISLFSEKSNKYPNWMINWKTEQEKMSVIFKKSDHETFSKQNHSNNKIGDEVTAGNFVYVVNKIEYLKTVENVFTSQTADGIYLLVYLTVLNTTRESRTVSNSMFKVFDSESYEYGTSQNALTILVLNDQDKVFLFKDIPPKIPKKIIMPFEVPTSNDVYTLQVSGGFWTGESAKILLQN